MTRHFAEYFVELETQFLQLFAPKLLRLHFGCPLSRRRIYIVLVRKDVCQRAICEENFCEYILNKLKSMECKPEVTWWFAYDYDVLQKPIVLQPVAFCFPSPGKISFCQKTIML